MDTQPPPISVRMIALSDDHAIHVSAGYLRGAPGAGLRLWSRFSRDGVRKLAATRRSIFVSEAAMPDLADALRQAISMHGLARGATA